MTRAGRRVTLAGQALLCLRSTAEGKRAMKARSVLTLVCVMLAAGACGEPRIADTSIADASVDAATSEGFSQTADDAAALPEIEPADYSNPEAWLCRPGRDDACAADVTATSVAADGRMRREAFAPDADPPIDCFYVYPTVSLDETPNADLVPGDEEQEVARQQFARFGSACRLYAPVYRQVTVPALRAMLRGETPATNRELAYADVKAAWAHYLANDNEGRGVVLVGHSQGAGLLTRLVASEIDGKPAQQDLLVSALLIGTNLAVADPHTGGGSFSAIKPCTGADETGCVIAYSSFRADAPPREGSLFGAVPETGMKAACVNPAEIDGSDGALKAYLPTRRITTSMAEPGPWTASGEAIETPHVSLPGLLTAQCLEQGGFSFLSVTVNADPADARTDMIVGDVVVDGAVQPGWGLHLIDMNLALGNLVDIVKRQGAAWGAKATPAEAR